MGGPFSANIAPAINDEVCLQSSEMLRRPGFLPPNIDVPLVYSHRVAESISI